LRNYENSSLGNWILARNFLKILFWPCLILCQLQDASIKPLCRVCSQKLKFLWPIVTFFELSEYSLSSKKATVGHKNFIFCEHTLHKGVIAASCKWLQYTLKNRGQNNFLRKLRAKIQFLRLLFYYYSIFIFIYRSSK
jgi:hypothetical protein